jgi:hypothetical protein
MKTFIVGASLSALTLFAGCAVQPSPGYSGYYGGYQTPANNYYQDGYFGYDNYGQPYILAGGQPALIIFEQNRGWGYYDIHQHWLPAPQHAIGVLERDHPHGHGLPAPRPIMGVHPQGEANRMGMRPGEIESRPMGVRPPGEVNHMGARPEAESRPMGAQPQGERLPMEPRPQTGPPPMGPRPQAGPPPMGARPQSAPAPVPARPQNAPAKRENERRER